MPDRLCDFGAHLNDYAERLCDFPRRLSDYAERLSNDFPTLTSDFARTTIDFRQNDYRLSEKIPSGGAKKPGGKIYEKISENRFVPV